ncbi:sulfite exporter TauE/SafE family protein [Candidatus Pelagibacter sp. HIMB1695]|uniref:sulfite exporter TauE/SafE family protein n=1 Tax=Candidatus Pelagibacter sp. HIMB1695 TaxID=3413364 RepID=UPI003F85C0B4
MIILTIFFFITAVLYSSIGFGGGSTYLALLLIWDLPYYIFPILALICNIIVVSGNSINFLKSKNINFNLLYPYLIGSIPFAFIGASISIDKNLFEILLFFILILAGIFLLIESKSFNKQKIEIKKTPLVLSILIGSIIGLMSGLVGIGGGIFLSPILFLMKAGLPKHITSTASLFILVNSIFGIGGQLTKDIVFNEFLNYWPLFIAVLIGGQIGSFLNIKFLSNKILALMTACLVIFVAIRMGITLIA